MSAPQSKSRLQIRGLLTIGDAIQQEIWLLASATLNPEGSAIADKINTTERQVRELCEQHAISPAQLPLQSQQVYAWLRLLSQPTMLAAHLETLRQLTQFIEQTPAAQKRRGDGVRWHVELAHCGYLYRSRTLPKQPHYWQFLFNECFIGAPEPVLYALAQLSFDRNAPALGIAKAYANSPAYHQIVLALQLVPAPIPAVLSGQHHDLQQVFARAVLECGLGKKATIHTLRHSYATHLLEAGVSIRLISQYLGHATLEQTMIYTHLTAVSEAQTHAALAVLSANLRRPI